MSRDAEGENTDNMLRNSVKFIVPAVVENTMHMRLANGFSCPAYTRYHKPDAGRREDLRPHGQS